MSTELLLIDFILDIAVTCSLTYTTEARWAPAAS